MSLRILVVESRPAVREALEVQLARAGYEATCTVDSREAAEQIAGVRPEVCFWGLLGSEDLPRLGEMPTKILNLWMPTE
jgi:CheY-like chemotaxis protein